MGMGVHLLFEPDPVSRWLEDGKRRTRNRVFHIPGMHRCVGMPALGISRAASLRRSSFHAGIVRFRVLLLHFAACSFRGFGMHDGHRCLRCIARHMRSAARRRMGSALFNRFEGNAAFDRAFVPYRVCAVFRRAVSSLRGGYRMRRRDACPLMGAMARRCARARCIPLRRGGCLRDRWVAWRRGPCSAR